jgi:hypothetical protein
LFFRLSNDDAAVWYVILRDVFAVECTGSEGRGGDSPDVLVDPLVDPLPAKLSFGCKKDHQRSQRNAENKLNSCFLGVSMK